MKKGGKLLFSFGVVIVVFSMVSSSTAVNVASSNNINIPIVDSHIHLTKAFLPSLEKSKRNIHDKNIEQILEDIQNCIIQKGVADSQDITNCLDRLGISNIQIRSGLIEGRCPCIRSFVALPGFSRVLFGTIVNLGFPIWHRYFGYSSFLTWEAYESDYEDISITINFNKKINTPHKGYILGFVGSAHQNCKNSAPLPHDFYFSFIGVGSLIIIDNNG